MKFFLLGLVMKKQVFVRVAPTFSAIVYRRTELEELQTSSSLKEVGSGDSEVCPSFLPEFCTCVQP